DRDRSAPRGGPSCGPGPPASRRPASAPASPPRPREKGQNRGRGRGRTRRVARLYVCCGSSPSLGREEDSRKHIKRAQRGEERAIRVRREGSLLRQGGRGEAEGEDASAPFPSGVDEGPLLRLGEATGDGEPQAGAAGVGGDPGRPVEGSEDPLPLRRRDPGAA